MISEKKPTIRKTVRINTVELKNRGNYLCINRCKWQKKQKIVIRNEEEGVELRL